MPFDAPSLVLLIEDDLAMCGLVALWLKCDMPKSAVQVVNHLQTALDALECQPVDAIILDLTLPDATDLQALNSIMGTMRGKVPLPVVILTARGENERWRVLENADVSYVTKGQPAVRAALMGALLSEWARYQERRQLITTWNEHYRV